MPYCTVPGALSTEGCNGETDSVQGSLFLFQQYGAKSHMLNPHKTQAARRKLEDCSLKGFFFLKSASKRLWSIFAIVDLGLLW